MHKIKRSVLGVSLTVVFLVFSTSCGRPTGTKAHSSVPKDLKNRLLQFHLTSEPEYLDPGLASGTPETMVLLSLFSGLVQHPQKDGVVIPELATRWEISEDGRIYTFYLRKDTVWTDGRPVTAHDFVYAWERVLNPATGSKYAYALYPIRNAVGYNAGTTKDPKQLGFLAVDDHTLKVTLENPTPYFLDLLWFNPFKPVPKWAVEKHGPRWTRPENIVSNGPFKLKSWTPYKEITVVKSETFYTAEEVKLPGIVFHPIEDKETALKMFVAGDMDILWEVPIMKAQTLKDSAAMRAGGEFVYTPYLGTYLYRLQTKKPPLDDARVRKALALAIDRKELCDKYLQGLRIPSASMVPAGLQGYEPIVGLDFDPERAKTLLAEAGYKDPSTFPPVAIHYNTDDAHKLIAEVIQQMWKKHLGINVTLWNEEWKSYMKTQNLMDYQISRSGWIGDYPDPMTFLDLWTSDSTMSHTGWKNPEYDEMIRQARQETRFEKRMAYLQLAESILLREAPVIPIYTYTKMYMIQPYVKGYLPNIQDIHPFQWVHLESALGLGGEPVLGQN